MEHFINFANMGSEQILDLLDLARRLKESHKAGRETAYLKGKTVGLIFNKPSTRTRISFEAGVYQLGGYGLHLSGQDLQLGHGETIEDTAKVLSRYLDAIMIRTFKQKDIEDLAEYGSIPVINGLSDLLHPCQVLADLLTIQEEFKQLKKLKLSYVGDGNNMANTLLQACSKLGIDISLATPQDYQADTVIYEKAKADSQKGGSTVSWTADPAEAVIDADVVYTDTWVSMGDESQKQERLLAFRKYQVNLELMQAAKKTAIFLHCLPAYRGNEVSADVIDGASSRVFDEAENRLHVQKAVLVQLLAKEFI